VAISKQKLPFFNWRIESWTPKKNLNEQLEAIQKVNEISRIQNNASAFMTIILIAFCIFNAINFTPGTLAAVPEGVGFSFGALGVFLTGVNQLIKSINELLKAGIELVQSFIKIFQISKPTPHLTPQEVNQEKKHD
jgi:hypothetical protein